MIQEFVDRYMESKEILRDHISDASITNYEDLVTLVMTILNPGLEYRLPNWKNIREIDDGNYQGTLLYIIPEVGYQPSKYWAVLVGYGSCSGCDTLEHIRDLTVKEEQIEQYMTLALHIVQGLKCISDTII